MNLYDELSRTKTPEVTAETRLIILSDMIGDKRLIVPTEQLALDKFLVRFIRKNGTVSSSQMFRSLRVTQSTVINALERLIRDGKVTKTQTPTGYNWTTTPPKRIRSKDASQTDEGSVETN
jgi:predicted HTH transcriptional regulator